MLFILQVLGILSWVSLFAQTWLSLLGYLNDTPIVVRFFSFLFFLLVAIFSSVATAAQEKQTQEFIAKEWRHGSGR